MLTPPLPQPTEPADAEATRRAFLKKVAIGGAAAALGSQALSLRAFAQEDEGDGGTGDASDDGSGESPGGGGSPTTEAGSEGESETDVVELTPDEARVTFLAGIAHGAAAVYRAAAGDEATEDASEEEEPSGGAATETTTTLPPVTVPPLAEPVVEVLRVFGSHHSQQAGGLNGLLTTLVDAPNGTFVAEFRGGLGSAADEAGVLTLLREMEERIAATHLQALAEMEDANDAKLIATALPVVSQHAVVLGSIGSSPTPLEELIPEEQTTEGFLDEETYPFDGTVAPEDTPGDTGTEEPEGSAGGEGADPDTGTETNPDDGTEQSGGGAEDGGSTGSGGGPNDPGSEG